MDWKTGESQKEHLLKVQAYQALLSKRQAESDRGHKEYARLRKLGLTSEQEHFRIETVRIQKIEPHSIIEKIDKDISQLKLQIYQNEYRLNGLGCAGNDAVARQNLGRVTQSYTLQLQQKEWERKQHIQHIAQEQERQQARELQQKRAEQGRIRLQQDQERASRELQAKQDQERAARELQAKRELQSMSKELLEMIMPQLKREMMRGYEDVSEQVESSANYIVSRMHN